MRKLVSAVAVCLALLGFTTGVAALPALADPPTLTGSNYNPPCNDVSVPYMSCLNSGGVEVIMTGTNLTGCTEIIQMGFGWTGNLAVTVNGDGTQISFIAPADDLFQGWALFNCGFQPSSFLWQSNAYPPLPDPVTVTASSPPDVTVGSAMPSVNYTTEPATVASDWTTEPMCAVYDANDLASPIATATTAGAYVTHCSGGVMANSAAVSYDDGALMVIRAPTPPPVPDPGGDSSATADNGLAMTGMSLAGLVVLSLLGLGFFGLAVASHRARERLGMAASNDRLGILLRDLNSRLTRLERPRRNGSPR